MNYKKILLILCVPIIICLILSIYIQSRYIQLSYQHQRLIQQHKKLMQEYEKIQNQIEKSITLSSCESYQPLTLQQIYSLTHESCNI